MVAIKVAVFIADWLYNRTPRGRVATAAAWKHLGYSVQTAIAGLL
ncbi:hypothetical protein VB775_15730 [Pseudanabaena sp. CCNP1317]|nr:MULTISPECIES: hypothetical protein [Pseudanabaena]MEA5488269.1 hypothetical protein [Pseudanabaena sp. CCNP1317]WGS72904.1 hypothetical protein OA858_02430 [Pseudanabaena galeata CCNP1313]